MKVLLLGGTGAIGSKLKYRLVDKNWECIITSRKNRMPEKGISFVKGDAHDISFLEELLKDRFDVIVDFMVWTNAEFSIVLPLFLKNTEQYIYISSCRVYADSKTIITENSDRLLEKSEDREYLLTDEYALLKARQEDLLRKLGTKNNYTIIRPYITFESYRMQLGVFEKEIWLYRVLNGRSIVFSKDMLDKKTTMTCGADVGGL